MKTTLIATMILLLGVAAWAQMEDSSTVVRLTVEPDTLVSKVGGRVAFDVDLAIEDGWHLYVHGDPQYMGIELTGLDETPLAAAKVDYPEGHEGVFLGEKTMLLEGDVTVSVSGILTKMPSEPLKLYLTMQACDASTCKMPADVPVRVTVLPER